MLVTGFDTIEGLKANVRYNGDKISALEGKMVIFLRKEL